MTKANVCAASIEEPRRRPHAGLEGSRATLSRAPRLEAMERALSIDETPGALRVALVKNKARHILALAVGSAAWS
jgi:hypothetical protein